MPSRRCMGPDRTSLACIAIIGVLSFTGGKIVSNRITPGERLAFVDGVSCTVAAYEELFDAKEKLCPQWDRTNYWNTIAVTSYKNWESVRPGVLLELKTIPKSVPKKPTGLREIK